MLSPGERAISREQAFVLLDRLDQVEAQRPQTVALARELGKKHIITA